MTKTILTAPLTLKQQDKLRCAQWVSTKEGDAFVAATSIKQIEVLTINHYVTATRQIEWKDVTAFYGYKTPPVAKGTREALLSYLCIELHVQEVIQASANFFDLLIGEWAANKTLPSIDNRIHAVLKAAGWSQQESFRTHDKFGTTYHLSGEDGICAAVKLDGYHRSCGLQVSFYKI